MYRRLTSRSSLSKATGRYIYIGVYYTGFFANGLYSRPSWPFEEEEPKHCPNRLTMLSIEDGSASTELPSFHVHHHLLM